MSAKLEFVFCSAFNPPSRKASADARVRFNSSVLAPFFKSGASASAEAPQRRRCSGVHTI